MDGTTKKKKAEEHSRQLEMKRAQEELLRKLRFIVDEEGFNRLMNVKAVNPELFQQALQYVFIFNQKAGRVIKDLEVREVLKKLSEKKEGGITFVRK